MKVARQWAGCLTWSQASRGEWSYPGITTRLLKQDLHKPQIQVGTRRAGRQVVRWARSFDGSQSLTTFLSRSQKMQCGLLVGLGSGNGSC